MRLTKYLETKGYCKTEIIELLQRGRVSLRMAGSNQDLPHVAVVDDLEIGYGDRVYVNTKGGLKSYYHQVKHGGLKENNRLKHETQGLKIWWRVAGAIGFILGGPLSGFLAYVAAKIIIVEDARSQSKMQSKKILIASQTILKWVAIGFFALPLSWWITRSLGWNQDILAYVQSQGRFKSYKDWNAVNELKRRQMIAIEDQRKSREDSLRAARIESERRKVEQFRLQDKQRQKQRLNDQDNELKAIAVKLIEMDLDPDKFSRSSTTCSNAKSLVSRLEALKEKRGVLDFNFWQYQSDMQTTSDSDWNGGLKQKGYIVDGKIKAFELQASVDDYIKTCDAMSVIP